MQENVIQNATIKSVSLSIADHGCLSGWLYLEYDSGGQGFGGYCLYTPDSELVKFKSNAGLWIWRVCEVVGVHNWESLPGKNIRVKGSHCGIEAIGHIIKNLWFCPREEMKD
jgi:hypothetical protein